MQQYGEMRLVSLFLLSLPFSCADETISGYADPKATYRLQELSGEIFAARATISFPEEGQVKGNAPCNTWSAQQSAPYPWIEISQIQVTRRACTALADEQRFFDALQKVTLAEVQGELLILSNDTGAMMVFARDP